MTSSERVSASNRMLNAQPHNDFPRIPLKSSGPSRKQQSAPCVQSASPCRQEQEAAGNEARFDVRRDQHAEQLRGMMRMGGVSPATDLDDVSSSASAQRDRAAARLQPPRRWHRFVRDRLPPGYRDADADPPPASAPSGARRRALPFKRRAAKNWRDAESRPGAAASNSMARARRRGVSSPSGSRAARADARTLRHDPLVRGRRDRNRRSPERRASLILRNSAAAVTCGIMKPGVQSRLWRQKAGSAGERRVDEHSRAALGQRSDLAECDGNDVGSEGDRPRHGNFRPTAPPRPPRKISWIVRRRRLASGASVVAAKRSISTAAPMTCG